MPGFMGIVSNKIKKFPDNFDVDIPTLTERIEETKRFDNAWFKRSINDKFLGDKVYSEDKDIFICSDGIMLNTKELKNIYNCRDNFHLIKNLYENSSASFPSELRGDFDGVIYDKSKDSWTLYTNHIGSKWVFYYFDKEEKQFIFGTELKMVVEAMRALGIEPKLCEEGAYFLLTFGYMLEDYTLVKGVRKLPPGSILTLKNWNLELKTYYRLQNTPSYIKDNEDKIIKTLDELFRYAISAEYNKDLENGYSHITTLSGGLDSRMNLYYAKKLGYKDILNITFSQSNYFDEQIAKKIASNWGYYFLFFSLDNGNYLNDIESPAMVNDGLVLFSGSAHLLKMLSLIRWEGLGLVHTGMLGDAVLGTYLMNQEHEKVNPSVIVKTAYSLKLLEKIDKKIFEGMKYKYTNSELFAFENRGFNGIFNGYRAVEQFSEYSSPFLHLDFLDYAIKIDPKHRFHEKIYLKWINKFAPEAARYRWEQTRLPISAGRSRIFLKRAIKYARKRILGPSAKDSMNPFDYWYKNNVSLRKTFELYFNNHIDLLSNNPGLKKDVSYLFNEGSTLEKAQSLTLLSAIKLHGLVK